MNSEILTDKSECWQALTWSLRPVIAIQCFGAACAVLLAAPDKPAGCYSLLAAIFNASRTATHRANDLFTAAMFICGILVLVVPLLSLLLRRVSPRPLQLLPTAVWQTPLLVTIIAWQFSTAVAAMLRGGDFSQWVIGSQAVRWGGPLGLLLLAPSLAGGSISRKRMEAVVMVLRYAAAATFIVHGFKAVMLHPPFIALLVDSARNLIWLELPAAYAAPVLQCIGVLDIGVAVLLVLTRWRRVALYMAAWGLIAAGSRITANGFAASPETLLRIANGGVALAVFIYWCYDHKQQQQPGGQIPDTAGSGQDLREDRI